MKQNSKTTSEAGITLTVVGLGLIGGSMAIDLKKRGFATRVIGVDHDRLHAATARNIGLVDEVCDLEKGVAAADLVLVAIPVDALSLIHI